MLKEVRTSMDRDLRPRAARYSFVANVTLTELESGRQSREQTWDLSLFGCHVVPGNCAPTGARVRVQIIHDGDVFEAQGAVMNSRPITGVGIAFMKVEEEHRQILDKWIAALTDKKSEDQVHGYDSYDRRTLAVKGDGIR
ncbi:MAG: hypothetical protein DMG36_26895 [Acidobacteria bacterium]|nr:MAG: hypothetical protein DMG36_26895 [Acidobacteriota bacterium]